MATGSISTLGLGSGLELQSMLEQLKEVDQQPIETKKNKVTTLQEKLEEFDSIKATLLSIRTKALDLSLGSNFLETKTGVTGTSIEATSVAGAKDMSHSVNVTALASFSSWTSEGVASKTGVLTTEDTTFSYRLGENGSTITLDVDAGTSLQKLANLINDDDSNPGVTASIADTGFGDNPYKLILRSDDPGEENRIFIETQLVDSPPESDNAVAISATEPIDVLDASGNNKIVFQERLADGSLGAERTATIADGTYTSGSDLAAAIESAMESESENGINYTVSYDSDTQKFSIKENGSQLHELNISWDASSAASALGFDAQEDVYKPHAGLKLTESTGAGFFAPESDNKVNISASEPAAISAANSNNEIVFRERLADGTLGAAKTATIADGSYESGDDLAAAIKSAMETASENSTKFSVLFNSETKKFTIKEDGSNLHELQIEWANSNAASTLGFDSETDTYKPYDSSLNARFSVDNIAYQRQSNDGITDVIQGITLDLKETGISTIGVDSDFEKVETMLQEVIDSINTLRTDLTEKSRYDVDKEEKGILFGEMAITRIDDELKNFMEQNLNIDGAVTSMYDLGLTIDSDGILSIDSDKFRDVLSSNAEDVIKFFTGDSENGVEGFGDMLYDKMRSYTAADGLLVAKRDSTQTLIGKLEEQIEKDTALLNKRYDTMTTRFVELDSYMRQMQSEASFLDQVFNTNKKDD
ncbi:FliD (modular protein) [Desulfamplus magnetovallimortis]|uniref:Flagellar hook-associated protein 2 n=1 Tax=Desulfamplus magnetovallimortis TaxID=1246637 RepID=A0A1W1H9U4_9BACT|nr:flagellar filament capping protein FliD [Desulfamplus magnetovallimortis]SLM29206.1 FliD (modular protein) [Desulfamplus magnetovallimortis]